MPKIVELPNGVEIEFPDDTPQGEMYKAINEYMAQQTSGISKQEGKVHPHLAYENPEDVGRAEGGKRLLKGIGKYGPELAASALVPEVPLLGALSKIPGLSRALQKIPTAAKYGQSIFGNALSQGGVAAAFNPETAKESGLTAAGIAGPFSGLGQLAQSAHPYVRGAGRLGMGAATGALAGLAAKNAPFGGYTAIPAALGGAYLGFKGGPTSRFQRDLRSGLEGSEYKPAVEAAERLGLDFLTPAEASGNPFLGAQQGSIGKSPEASLDLFKKQKGRQESETEAIKKLMDTMFHPKEAKTKKALYEQINKPKIKENKLTKFTENDIIKDAEKQALDDSAFRQDLKNLGRDSVGYWDVVKQKIDDMASSASKDANKRRFSKIDSARKSLLEELDKVAPTYKDARYLHERDVAREKLENHFSNRKMIGTNMFKAISDKKKFQDFMKQMRGVPEAQSQLKDMRLVFENIINPVTARSASALSKTSMDKARSSMDGMITLLKDKLTAGRFDKGAVELITNPKWEKELHNLATKPGNKEKRIAKFIDLIGKAGAQTAAQPNLNINFRYNEPLPEEGNMDFEYEGME